MRAARPRLSPLRWFGSPLAGQGLAPEILALSRASGQVRQTVAALANCECLESVTRGRVSKKGKAEANGRDTLQIEVATIGGREWFSWPGRDDILRRRSI